MAASVRGKLLSCLLLLLVCFEISVVFCQSEDLTCSPVLGIFVEHDTDFMVNEGNMYILPEYVFPCSGVVEKISMLLEYRADRCYSEILTVELSLWEHDELGYVQTSLGSYEVIHTAKEEEFNWTISPCRIPLDLVTIIHIETSVEVSAGSILGVFFPVPKRENSRLTYHALPIGWEFTRQSPILSPRTCWNPSISNVTNCFNFIRYGRPYINVSGIFDKDTTEGSPTPSTMSSPSTSSPSTSTPSTSSPSTIPSPSTSTTSVVSRTSNNGAAVALGVLFVIALLVLVVVAVVLAVVLLVRRRKLKQVQFSVTASNPVAMSEQDEYLTVNPSVEGAVYESLGETGLGMCERREEEGGMTLGYSLLHQSDDKKRATLISQNNVETSYSSIVSYAKVDRRSQYLNPQMDGMPVPSMEDRKNMAVEDISNDTYAQCEEMENDLYWIPAQTKEGIYDQMSKKKYREVPRKCLTVRDLLGEGEFGQVFYGEWLSSFGPVEVAVKVSNNADSEERVKLLQEAAVMGQFLHARVVRLYGVVTFDEPNMVVIEYVKNGELLDYLDNIGLPAPTDLPEKLLRFCTEICDGLNYLSKKGFIHRDLAARNILLDKDYHCKIADFGMSRRLDDDSYYITKGGRIPLKWTAPEAILYRKYSSKSDVWSYGMVMYEIWSLGHKPFEEFSTDEVLDIFGSGFCLSPPPGCPRGIYSLLVNCWNPDHHNRCSIQELFNALSSSHQETLLSWSEEDRSVSPQADVLGAPLEEGENLYRDLQMSYKN